MEHETFFSLLHDAAHWQFELFLIGIFDVLIGMIIWPIIKKYCLHHKRGCDKITRLEQEIEKLKNQIDLRERPELIKNIYFKSYPKYDTRAATHTKTIKR